MIDVKELRISNYIYDDFNEIHIVENIQSQKFNDWNGSDLSLVVFSKLKDTYQGMYTCDVVSGIPLTPELLEKCKFALTVNSREGKYLQYGLKSSSFDFMFEFYNLGEPQFYLDMVGVDIIYLHQLQNLYFALTGEELQINL